MIFRNIINSILILGCFLFLCDELSSDENAVKIYSSVVEKVTDRIKDKIPPDQISLYKDFIFQTLKLTHLENLKKQDIRFLGNSISKTIITLNKKHNWKNEKPEKLRIKLNSFIKRHEGNLKLVSLEMIRKDWKKYTEKIDFFINLTSNILKAFFESHPVVVFDIETNRLIAGSSFDKAPLNNQKSEKKLKSSTKKLIMQYIQKNTDIMRNQLHMGYDSIFLISEFKNQDNDLEKIKSDIQKYLNDYFVLTENIIFISSLTDIDLVLFKIVSYSLMGKKLISPDKHIQMENIRMSFDFLLKSLNVKEFKPAHYGKQVDWNKITRLLSFQKENTSDVLNAEQVNKIQKLNQILNLWFSGLSRDIKFISYSEEEFLWSCFIRWKKRYNPLFDKLDNQKEDIKIAAKAFEELMGYIDCFYNIDKKSCPLFLEPDEPFSKKAYKFERRYLTKAEVKKRYADFAKNIRMWLNTNYVDKKRPEELETIRIQKSFNLLLMFLLNDIKSLKKLKFSDYKYRKISSHAHNAKKRLLTLNLISNTLPSDALIEKKKLSEIEEALYKYYRATRNINPVFTSSDTSVNTQDLWKKYLEFRNDVNDKVEKEAYSTIIDLLFSSSKK